MRCICIGTSRMSAISIASFDPQRVLRDLYALRKIGEYKTGVHRPALSPEHIASLDWLAKALPAAGLTATIDGIGNVLGTSRKPGKKLLSGSHLESQNQAGWLDGPLGVIYALEAARVINGQPGFDGAVEVASWCDEEGHFGNFLGSLSYVGKLADADIDAAVDRTDGRRMRDALAAAGYASRPRLLVEHGRYIGYIEAHIEQGDWLEANDLKIGVVTAIVGARQFKIDITGVQNHAGTTRMAIRKDAGLSAANLLVTLDDAFRAAAGPRSVWTTGRITLDPGAPSIIPGHAEVLFQIRDDDPEILEALEALLRATVAAHHAKGPCQVAIERVRASTPAKMDQRFQNAIEAAAGAHAAGSMTKLPSGAGHDAQILSDVMPSAMMFIPSIGGISHHWSENTTDADIALGAKVFVDACARILGT